MPHKALGAEADGLRLGAWDWGIKAQASVEGMGIRLEQRLWARGLRLGLRLGAGGLGAWEGGAVTRLATVA